HRLARRRHRRRPRAAGRARQRTSLGLNLLSFMDKSGGANSGFRVLSAGISRSRKFKFSINEAFISAADPRLEREAWIERLVLVAALLSTWRRMPNHAASSDAVELTKVLHQL